MIDIKRTAFIATVSALAAFLGACKPGYQNVDSSLTADDPTFIGVTSDAKWEFTMNDEEDDTQDFRLRKYNAIDGEIAITITGTFEILGTDFTKLTVDTATGTDDLEKDDTLTALVASENYAVFIEPFERNETQVIALIPKSDCPSGNTTAGAVTIRSPASLLATNSGQAFYGALTQKTTEEEISWDGRRSLTKDSVDGAEIFEGDECKDGIAFTNSNAQVFGANNSAIFHEDREDPESDRILFALSNEDLASRAQLNASYAGFMYDPSGATVAQQFQYVATTCSEGICAIRPQSNIGTISNSGTALYTLTLETPTDNYPNGFIEGTLASQSDEPPGTANVGCNINSNIKNNNGKIMICAAQAPSSTARVLNFFLVSE